MGAVSVWFGVPAAIAVGGLLHAPAMALYVRALGRGEPPREAPDIELPSHIEITGMPNPE